MAGSQVSAVSSQFSRFTAALFALALLLSFAGLARSAELGGEAEARRVVQGLGESIVEAVKINDLAQRRRLLTATAAPAVDFKALGAGLLAHAEVQVPPGQQAEITEGLTAYISRIILDEIDQIHPSEAKLGAATAKGPNEIRVAMALAGPNRKIDADWVLRNSGTGWRVTDIVVSGYSLTAHYGAMLARRVRGSVEQLADMMSTERRNAPRPAPMLASAPAAAPVAAPIALATAAPAVVPVAVPATSPARMEVARPVGPQLASTAASAVAKDDWKLRLTDLLRF